MPHTSTTMNSTQFEPTKWAPSDISNPIPIRSNILELQDNKKEWNDFTIIVTKERIVFGGCCNVGFLESGYIERDSAESLDNTLCDLFCDLETYYNDGPQYVSRIVFNERM